MSKQLFIPDKIKVGYQERGDTYTKMLAYVIYYDQKGKLRKEKSWKSWCDLPGNPSGYHYGRDTANHKGIEPNEFENVPMEGFVLNKKVGDYKSDWNHRKAHIRVFDPRGFEFEISVENLLFILAEGDCTKGKGLEGKFVYSWDGTELVLLPTHCNDYQNCTKFTKLQGMKVSAKELVPGCTYEDKSQGTHIYMGRMHSFEVARVNSYREEDTSEKVEKSRKRVGKKSHIFYNPSSKSYEAFKSMSTLAKCSDTECHPDFAELLEEYDVSFRNTPIASMELKRLNDSKSDNYMELNGELRRCSRNCNDYQKSRDETRPFDPVSDYYSLGDTFILKDGVLSESDTNYRYTDIVHRPGFDTRAYSTRNSYHYSWYRQRENHNRFHELDVNEKSPKSLIVTLEDGKRFVYNGYSGFKIYKGK